MWLDSSFNINFGSLPRIYVLKYYCIRDSIVVSIPACHAGDRGSIPRLGVFFHLFDLYSFLIYYFFNKMKVIIIKVLVIFRINAF